MDELQLSRASPEALRVSHAEYFLRQYVQHSGPPIDSYWLMIGYFDAFLFALASVYDMSPKTTRGKLNGVQVLKFFVALRNISAHHSVLSAGAKGSKFPRPFSRAVSMSAGGAPANSSRLFFRFDVLGQILDAVELEWPKAKKNIETARRHIGTLVKRGTPVYLEDQMRDAIAAIRCIVPMSN